ncbi:MAG: conjugal transfer protein TraF, partial [Gammaproteobacteria bacterium]|nr:conjugal transfer protein TraF [Gammaproteobacteria bacterium]
MKNRRYAHLSAAVMLVGLSAPALVSAAPFISMDPRSLGMGGTGVASGNSANASFVNPALLATADN